MAATRALPRVPGDGGLLADVRRLCAAVRCSEVDDFDRLSCTTPGSVAVPVALLVGGAQGGHVHRGHRGRLRGDDRRRGGDRRTARLGQGIWPSYLGAAVAAAATTAAVLALDEDRATHALAIAATRSAGARGRIAGEPTSRWLTFGCAAADGVLAALAAERDARRPRCAAGPRGRARSDDRCAGAADRARRHQAVLHRRQAHAAVEAARTARGELGDAAIAEIEVGAPAAYRAMVDQPEPGARMTSIIGAQLQIALALTDDDGLYDVARDDLSLPEGAAELMAVTTRSPTASSRSSTGALRGARADARPRRRRGALPSTTRSGRTSAPWAGPTYARSTDASASGASASRTSNGSAVSLAPGRTAPARELLQLMTDRPQEAVR